MSKERFTERQANVRESAARLLGGMAERIQTLEWD